VNQKYEEPKDPSNGMCAEEIDLTKQVEQQHIVETQNTKGKEEEQKIPCLGFIDKFWLWTDKVACAWRNKPDIWALMPDFLRLNFRLAMFVCIAVVASIWGYKWIKRKYDTGTEV